MTLVDGPAAIRGASRGFTVLLLGGIVQPWVGTLLPPLGFVWLALVAVAAFAVAALAAGGVESAWTTAVAAAIGSYLLVLPLVVSAGALDPAQLAGTLLAAVATGASTPVAARGIGRLRNVGVDVARSA